MLSRPVADYLPSFAQRGKAGVTIRHLLAHSSGLPDDLPLPLDTIAPQPELVEAICQQPLVFAPGSRSSYCTWGYVILADLVCRASGRGLEALARERLFDPLAMRSSTFDCRPELRPAAVPAFGGDMRRDA